MKMARIISILLTSGLLATAVRADIIAQESFNYGGSSGNWVADGGSVSGTGGVGLNSTTGWGSYYYGGIVAGISSYDSTGLSFGSMLTSGGAMRVTTESYSSVSGTRSLSATTSPGESVFISYLFSAATLSGSLLDETGITFDSQAQQSSIGNLSLSGDFRSPFSGDIGAAIIRTNGTWVGGALMFPESSTFTYSEGTTYMQIAKLTNNGGSGEQTLSSWIITADQYDYFVENGITEEELNAATIGTASNEVLMAGSITNASAEANIAQGDLISMFGWSSETAGDSVDFIDEFKIGETMGDVTAIPEPTVMLLIVSAAFVLLVTKRMIVLWDRRLYR